MTASTLRRVCWTTSYEESSRETRTGYPETRGQEGKEGMSTIELWRGCPCVHRGRGSTRVPSD